ncbi:MAG: ribose 5-phosphate isomerase B [Sedimentisphaerales bacterium]|nr:ribose 5-phosphate isomerase B [Sedimentisphaerales bacterium]
MKIAIASDHAGFNYKEQIKKALAEQGHEMKDFGTNSAKSCDYPDFVRPAAEAVASGEFEHGIVLGGSGNGEAMVANKVSGIRCALCWDLRSARLGREHNNANMLSLGERMISISEALEIVDIFLTTEFEGGRHQRRVDKIESA